VNLHASTNSSHYGVHILRLLIRTGDAADTGIHILEQMRGERPLVPHVSHLFFSDVLLFAFPGPIAGTSPLLLVAASQWTCHVDVERKIQSASCRPLTSIPVTFHHVNAQEGPSIDFHGELSQDQSALLISRLNLLTELFAVVGGVGE
jgi:hypothetical protein